MKKEKKAIAYHEAGHAVVSFRLEPVALIAKLSIRFDGSTDGRVTAESLDSYGTREEIEEEIISLYAGEAAEYFSGVDHPGRPEGYTTADLLRIAELLDLLEDPDSGKGLKQRAEYILGENRKALDLVAAELLEHEELDMEEFLYLMEIADGEDGAREGLANWRMFKAARVQNSG